MAIGSLRSSAQAYGVLAANHLGEVFSPSRGTDSIAGRGAPRSTTLSSALPVAPTRGRSLNITV